jgi:signal transduction histidine kinase
MQTGTGMTAQDDPQSAPPPPKPRLRGLGLSGKLLLLTILFVMISEVLIYAPSIANFRVTWLEDRLGQARLAARVFDAAPDANVPMELQERLLEDIGASTLAVRRGATRQLLAVSEMPDMVDTTVDLRQLPPLIAVRDAFALLVNPDPGPMRLIGSLGMLEGENRATGPPSGDSDQTATGLGDFIEIVVDQAPLRQAMLGYSLNILTLSIFISVITAGLVYLSLNWLLIRPMRRITGAMIDFRSDPEDTRRIIAPSPRGDEIGMAERELQTMQQDLSGMLSQKNRLAALGMAVSKISHDLRNMLASAQLIGDRVGEIDDPAVQRFAPKLVGTLDRAIGFCADTLRYGRAQEPAPRIQSINLRSVVEEVRETLFPEQAAADTAANPGEATPWIAFLNGVDQQLMIEADPDHLFRVLTNLCRNAAHALKAHDNEAASTNWIAVWAVKGAAETRIMLADNGPGIPQGVRDTLFQPFGGTTSVGGSGLGLAIAAELIRAHGGQIKLAAPEDIACQADGGHPVGFVNELQEPGNPDEPKVPGESGVGASGDITPSLQASGAIFEITLRH